MNVVVVDTSSWISYFAVKGKEAWGRPQENCKVLFPEP